MEQKPERERGWIVELGSYALWAVIALVLLGVLYMFFFGRIEVTAISDPTGRPMPMPSLPE